MMRPNSTNCITQEVENCAICSTFFDDPYVFPQYFDIVDGKDVEKAGVYKN